MYIYIYYLSYIEIIFICINYNEIYMKPLLDDLNINIYID